MNLYIKLFSFLSTSLLLVLLLSSPALAHDPLILLPEQKTPVEGPFLPDGTISFALYGSLLEEGDQRGFQFKLEPEGRLDISLLIPNLEPENQMLKENFPRLFLYRPDGSVLEGVSDLYVPFDEPFSMTRYVRIFEHVEQSAGGLHQVKITGNHPSRFTVAIGYIESFGTPVENVPNRDAGRTGIFDWYQNPVEENTSEALTEKTATTVVQESIPETTVPAIEKSSEKTATTVVQESMPETTVLSKEKSQKPPEGETVEPVVDQVASKSSENNETSSSKIYVPVVAGLLLLLFLIRFTRQKNSSNRVDDQ